MVLESFDGLAQNLLRVILSFSQHSLSLGHTHLTLSEKAIWQNIQKERVAKSGPTA